MIFRWKRHFMAIYARSALLHRAIEDEDRAISGHMFVIVVAMLVGVGTCGMI